MQRSKLSRDEGSASLEFITAGLLLLIPLVYLVLAMSAIQGGALSVEGASRQAARVFVQAPDEGSADTRAQTAVKFALSDFGLGSAPTTVTVTCRPNPGVCLTRRGFVTVTVTANVPLPLVPNVLALKTPLSVPMTATSTEQVSRFWGEG
jgi:Flp pilus assembly protein TadG